MREEGCRVICLKEARKLRVRAGEISDAPEDLVERDFRADAPNELWLTSITEFHIPVGKVCLSLVVDCFGGMAVSLRMSTSPNVELTSSMLEAACSMLDKGESSGCTGHPRFAGIRDGRKIA